MGGVLPPLVTDARCGCETGRVLHGACHTKARFLQRPDFHSGFLDGFLQGDDPSLIEPAQKISRRGRIRNPFGIESVHVGFVVTQPLDVFQAAALR